LISLKNKWVVNIEVLCNLNQGKKHQEVMSMAILALSLKVESAIRVRVDDTA
jgi:hypothetical protein